MPQPLSILIQQAQQQWHSPRPIWNAFDLRSSDNGLLNSFYSNLHHAADHEWLNGGRALIDKTYLQMLWTVTEMDDLSSIPPERTATALDQIIREMIAPKWPLSTHQGNLAVLFDTAKRSLFLSQEHPVATSWLFFYLFADQPLFPIRANLCHRIQQHTPQLDPSIDYPAYCQHCTDLMLQDIPMTLQNAIPLPSQQHGNADENARISKLLTTSNWWLRNFWLHQWHH